MHAVNTVGIGFTISRVNSVDSRAIENARTNPIQVSDSNLDDLRCPHK